MNEAYRNLRDRLDGKLQFLPDKPKQSDIDALTKASQQISRRLGHAGPQDTMTRRRKASAAR